MTRATSDTNSCPCGSGLTYASCCAPLHDDRPAPDAQALMRSRYTAYVLKLEDYLLKTWHPDTRPAALDLAKETSTKWLGLEVKRFEVTGEDTAMVEYVARYKVNGKAERLHEISKFVKLDKWYYLDGEIN